MNVILASESGPVLFNAGAVKTDISGVAPGLPVALSLVQSGAIPEKRLKELCGKKPVIASSCELSLVGRAKLTELAGVHVTVKVIIVTPGEPELAITSTVKLSPAFRLEK